MDQTTGERPAGRAVARVLRRWRRFGAVLAGAVAIAGLTAGPAAAQPPFINPCNYSDLDGPCRMSDGVYRILLPRGQGPHPAVVYLYGSLGQSRTITDAQYFREEVVRRGFALIVPAALGVTYRGGQQGTGWGRRARTRHPRDDRAFIAKVLREASYRFGIDRERVLFVGQSDGGFMVTELACHHPEMAAAFAAHAASYGGSLPRACRGPVRYLAAHGFRDPVVPFAGELRVGPFLQGADPAATRALLARAAGCSGAEAAKGRVAGFVKTGWSGCRDGASVDLLAHRGGHNPPPAWMPAVLDWFEEGLSRPTKARTVRADSGSGSGFGSAGVGLKGARRPGQAGGAGGLFKKAPD